MTVELARRLLEGEIIAAAEVEAALLDGMLRGVPLIQIIAERSPELARRVERELERGAPASVSSVRASPELAARLPPGMCERLLAVPVFGDRETDVVDVACVDPSDPHVRAEFSFQLQSEVRALRAPLSEITAAIEGLHAGGSFLPGVNRVLGGAPAAAEPSMQAGASAGEAAPPREPIPQRASQRPIPLVRKSLAPKPRPQGEEPLRAEREREHQAMLRTFVSVGSADDLVARLLAALGRIARRVALFAVKSAYFEGRAGSGPDFGSEQLRTVRVPQDSESILRSAQDAGHYLGPLAASEAHAPLAPFLDAQNREVYAVRVSVSGRGAIIAVISGFEEAFVTTRAADEIAEAASRALERVVRTKKASR
jgi:hypothetical protein